MTCPLLLMGAMMDGLLVASTASEVRPWKALLKDTILVRPLWNEASFKAFSLASAPLLIRNRL